jgi:hypothetical protein
MNRLLILNCPKQEDKRYFSFAEHQYQNNLTVLFNNNALFENIDDAEENLPIVMRHQISFDMHATNTICLIYDIKFGKQREKTDVDFLFDPINSICTINLERKNYVIGSEKLTGDYKITLSINNQKYFLDKDFHKGDLKKLSLQTYVDIKLPIYIELESKKVFEHSDKITYDQIVLKII